MAINARASLGAGMVIAAAVVAWCTFSKAYRSPVASVEAPATTAVNGPQGGLPVSAMTPPPRPPLAEDPPAAVVGHPAPATPTADLLSQAEAAIEAQDLPRAKPILQKILAQDPAQQGALRLYEQLFILEKVLQPQGLSRRDLVDALTVAQQSLQARQFDNSDTTSLLLSVGSEAVHASPPDHDLYAAALASLLAASERYPGPDIYEAIGQLAHLEGTTQQALQALTAARDAGHLSPPGSEVLAGLYQEVHRDTEAVAALLDAAAAYCLISGDGRPADLVTKPARARVENKLRSINPNVKLPPCP